MQLHNLQSKTRRLKSRPIGRGGKRGTTSGRGTKGQKARAGHRMRPELRDIIKKIPKLRGYQFPSIQDKPLVINVAVLEKAFAKGDQVDGSSLVKAGLLTRREADRSVKILGTGELTKALTISGLKVSAEAKRKVESAGGKIV